ncbi:MAG: hypothetical protein AAGH89_08875 [Verrucomicrobiota bacterium]
MNPRFIATAIAMLAISAAWGAEIKDRIPESDGAERKSLADLLGLNSLSSRFRFVPLEVKVSEVAEPAAELADEALLNKEPAKPFIPATMVEGKLTSRLDVAYEVERLKSVVGKSTSKSARAPSSALLAVLQENQAERERLLMEERLNRQTMIASNSSPPKPNAKPEKKDESQVRPFLLLAKLDSRNSANQELKPGEKSKAPKLALLLTRNPNRARTSRKSSASDEDSTAEELKADGPIRQLSPSGRELEFSAVENGGAPFHVFDFDPSETFLIELEGGAVGRVQDQGKEWAWLQLDSGLMGVMRNKHLRPASREEVMEFLALETAENGAAGEEMAIGVMELDLDVTDLPLGGSTSDSAPDVPSIRLPTEPDIPVEAPKEALPLE